MNALPDRLLWIGPLTLAWIASSFPLYSRLRDLHHHQVLAQIVRFGSQFAAAAAVVGSLLFLTKLVRDRAAIVFDLTGMWPPRHHPLAGRPYSGPVLDQLEGAVRSTVEEQPLTVIGHSQGSILAYLVLLRLPPESRRSVILVTCGSPLGSLYRTYFPRYFPQSSFDGLRAGRASAPASWVNLYRDTDPIGGPIFDAETERLLEDRPIPSEEALYRPKVHSDYWSQVAVRRAVDGQGSGPRPPGE